MATTKPQPYLVICHKCGKQGHIQRACRTSQFESVNNSLFQSANSSCTSRSLKPQGKFPEEHITWKLYHKVKYCRIYIYSVDSSTDKVEPLLVNVDLNGVGPQMEVNTGAAVSIISEKKYKTLWLEDCLQLKPSSTRLKTFTGEIV